MTVRGVIRYGGYCSPNGLARRHHRRDERSTTVFILRMPAVGHRFLGTLRGRRAVDRTVVSGVPPPTTVVVSRWPFGPVRTRPSPRQYVRPKDCCSVPVMTGVSGTQCHSACDPPVPETPAPRRDRPSVATYHCVDPDAESNSMARGSGRPSQRPRAVSIGARRPGVSLLRSIRAVYPSARADGTLDRERSPDTTATYHSR